MQPGITCDTMQADFLSTFKVSNFLVNIKSPIKPKQTADEDLNKYIIPDKNPVDDIPYLSILSTIFLPGTSRLVA